ncbi:MAG: hypothetical protein K0Q71_5660 [Thermomicrobiales bacterium]|nr:hypothetical protein [Thermomicrobiales bacterium]
MYGWSKPRASSPIGAIRIHDDDAGWLSGGNPDISDSPYARFTVSHFSDFADFRTASVT